MKYIIDFNSATPAYQQLYLQVREDIINGIYPFGSKLPSKRTVALNSNISTVTVEHAYALLCEEGYIEARERSGYFVITEFFFKEDKCDIIMHDVDIVGKTVKTENHTIALPSPTEVEEQEISTPFGKRKMAYLLVGDARIPVDTTSLDTDDIIKKFA